MQIEIEINDRMFILDGGFDRNSRVSDIKQIIYDRESISTEQQRLVFMGHALEDDHSLAYYNVNNLDSIVLQRKASKRQFWTSLVYLGSFIGLGLFMSAPGPILHKLQNQVHADLGAISFVFSARAIGYIIGSVIFGILSDVYASHYQSYGRFANACWPFRPHHLFGLCLFILAIAYSSLIYIHDLVTLAIIMSLTGLCSGGIDCFGNVLLLSLFDTDNEKDQLVAPYMQLLHFAFAIGACLSPLLIQVSFEYFDSYQIGFWIMSIVCIIFGFIILLIPTPLRKKKRSIPSIHSSTTDSSLMSDDVHLNINRNKQPLYGSFNESANFTIDSDGSSSAVSANQLEFRIFVILSCAIFLGIYVGSEVSFGAYITSYASQSLHTSIEDGIYMTAMYWGGLSVGRFVSIFVSKKVKPHYMLVIDLLGCFVAASLLVIDNDLMVAWIGSFLFGFFMASIFPCIFLVAEQAVKVEGKHASIMIFGASCGEFIIPWTEGNVMNTYGYDEFAVFTVILIMVLFVVMLILLLGIYGGSIKKKVTGFFQVS